MSSYSFKVSLNYFHKKIYIYKTLLKLYLNNFEPLQKSVPMNTKQKWNSKETSESRLIVLTLKTCVDFYFQGYPSICYSLSLYSLENMIKYNAVISSYTNFTLWNKIFRLFLSTKDYLDTMLPKACLNVRKSETLVLFIY